LNKLTTTIPDGYLIDFIDDTFRKDTPEEYVRQNIEKRLVNEHKYLMDQIRVEMPIKIGSGNKFIDLAIFDDDEKHHQENIRIIIETKSEKVESSHKKDGIDQLKSYMAACLNCEWGMWTNGKTKFVFKKIPLANKKQKFIEFNDIPSKGYDVSEIDRPTRDFLKLATEDNLLYAFKTSHNHIYVNDGMQKQQAFFELLKVIFCKILDERDILNKLEFYASSSEKLSSDGQLTVQKRISKIYDKVKKKYPKIFLDNDKINLKPVSLSNVVSELQKYSLLDTYVDVKGKAYEEIVGSNLRGDRGEFFTPRNIAKMAVKMLDVSLDAHILDPACGTGGFLVIGMNNVIQRLKNQMEINIKTKQANWSVKQHHLLREKINEIASENFFGFDINPDLVKATKMNMVMNNDGSGNILQNDSLKPPHEWDDDLKNNLCLHFGLEKDSIRRESDLALFDIIVTNPPFGQKLPIKDVNVLEQFDLAYIWEKDDSGKIMKTNRLSSSRSPEVLFIERCYQFLKPGGRMAIVLPDAILGAPGIDTLSIREWILQKCKLIASIDLHVDTFQPRNGTQTSVLILQKKTQEELDNPQLNYNVFFGIVDKVGHDKRGAPLYKRDESGNEIIMKYNQIIDNSSQTRKMRILDDQTNDISDSFFEWKKQEGLDW